MVNRIVAIIITLFLHVAMGMTGDATEPAVPEAQALVALRELAFVQKTNANAWLEFGVASSKLALMAGGREGVQPSASSFDEALNALKEGLRYEPHNFKLHVAIARVYEWRAMCKSFNRDPGRYDDLQQALNHSSQAISNVSTAFVRSRIEKNSSRYRELLEAERAIDAQTDRERQLPQFVAEANEAALTSLRKRLKATPDNPNIWYEYGTQLVLQYLGTNQQDSLIEAQRAFEKIIKMDHRYGAAYASLGQTFELQGSLTNALKYYQITLVMNPERKHLRAAIDRIEAQLASKPKNLGGGGFAQANVIDGAVENLRKRAEAEVNNSRAQSEYAAVLMGVEYYNNGKKDVLPRVQKILEKAVQLDHENGNAYEFLGRCLEAQGQYAPALTNYRQAVIHGHDTQFIRSRIEAITRILNDN